MADTLFPVIDVPELIDDDGLYDYRYHPSYRWDIASGDFVRDGACKIEPCDGEEGYKVWCIKAVQTERYRCMAYPDEIGSEMESAMRHVDQEAVKSAVERTITETLLTNPRTEYVREFEYEQTGDGLKVTFVVKGVNIDEFQISALLEGGEDED